MTFDDDGYMNIVNPSHEGVTIYMGEPGIATSTPPTATTAPTATPPAATTAPTAMPLKAYG